jgi:hypothetical protein
MDLLQHEAMRRVQSGATFLDEHISDWYKAIDLENFCIDSGCHCILGQLFNAYTIGLKHLIGHIDVLPNELHTFATQHGFIANAIMYKTHMLDAAWAEEINKRKDRDNGATN